MRRANGEAIIDRLRRQVRIRAAIVLEPAPDVLPGQILDDSPRHVAGISPHQPRAGRFRCHPTPSCWDASGGGTNRTGPLAPQARPDPAGSHEADLPDSDPVRIVDALAVRLMIAP